MACLVPLGGALQKAAPPLCPRAAPSPAHLLKDALPEVELLLQALAAVLQVHPQEGLLLQLLLRHGVGVLRLGRGQTRALSRLQLDLSASGGGKSCSFARQAELTWVGRRDPPQGPSLTLLTADQGGGEAFPWTLSLAPDSLALSPRKARNSLPPFSRSSFRTAIRAKWEERSCLGQMPTAARVPPPGKPEPLEHQLSPPSPSGCPVG